VALGAKAGLGVILDGEAEGKGGTGSRDGTGFAVRGDGGSGDVADTGEGSSSIAL